MHLPRGLSYLAAFAIATVIACISGCASTKALATAAEPSGDQALVYFIRYKYPPYIHELQISADKKLVATLANSDYVSVNLPIGEHAVDLTIMDGRPLSFKLPIDRSERV